MRVTGKAATARGKPAAGDGAPRERAQQIAGGLFPHQVEGVAFLLSRRRAILADDMGLGKTRQAIIALRVEEPDGPYLVVCPASVKRNWAREIQVALPQASVQVIDGKNDDASLDAEWVVVNYDILGAHAERLAQHGWAGLVFDEAHYIKNHKSQRSSHARQLVAAADDPVVYALTGTPLTNRPRDLFPLLQLCGHPLGRSFLSYAKRYCDAQQTEYGWVTDGASNLAELAVQLKGVMLRRAKDDVLELPPKLRTWLSVDVPRGVGAKDLAAAIRMLLQRGSPEPSHRPGGEAGDRARLLAHLSTARLKLAAAKVGETIEFVQNAVDQGEKVIVFSCYDEPLKKLQQHFGAACVLLTGATPTNRRQALVDRFQEDDTVRVFVANIIAGGVGINLTAGRQVVFNDLDWVPANHWQAEDRAYRIGQTNTVHVTYMVADNPLDEFVQSVLELKQRLVKAVVEGKALEEVGGSVLDELERLLATISPRIADLQLHDLDEQEVAAVIREAAAAAEHESEADPAATDVASKANRSAAMEKALELLAQALGGPRVQRFRVSSNSRPGQHYELQVDAGGDVTCSCPGFEYRGQCSHARELKAAVAKGREPPASYQPVAA